VRRQDPELSQLARADVERLSPEISASTPSSRNSSRPLISFDDRDAIVEVRAGTDSGVVRRRLFRMYRASRAARLEGRDFSLSEGTLGGLKEAVFAAQAPRRRTLRYESGVHRAACPSRSSRRM
jgi:peptide chain release factor 1